MRRLVIIAILLLAGCRTSPVPPVVCPPQATEAASEASGDLQSDAWHRDALIIDTSAGPLEAPSTAAPARPGRFLMHVGKKVHREVPVATQAAPVPVIERTNVITRTITTTKEPNRPVGTILWCSAISFIAGAVLALVIKENY